MHELRVIASDRRFESSARCICCKAVKLHSQVLHWADTTTAEFNDTVSSSSPFDAAAASICKPNRQRFPERLSARAVLTRITFVSKVIRDKWWKKWIALNHPPGSKARRSPPSVMTFGWMKDACIVSTMAKLFLHEEVPPRTVTAALNAGTSGSQHRHSCRRSNATLQSLLCPRRLIAPASPHSLPWRTCTPYMLCISSFSAAMEVAQLLSHDQDQQMPSWR